MSKNDISVELVRALFHYDPETGVFTRKIRRSNMLAGAIATWRDVHGYLGITIDKRQYKAHRLAWLYVHGVMPEQEIDHINRITDDNRIANLRQVTRSRNRLNIVGANRNNLSTGVMGVSRLRDRYVASIRINGRSKHLGMFDSVEEASAAYRAYKSAHDPQAVLVP